MNSLEDKLGPG